ncbi:hypothetical protein MKEN_01110900 [Mycena kentingensis (nom. inval.)]|nr:hypothetical protein MKEN_01110900 [Mycena kentingensis (nom. inval.)]
MGRAVARATFPLLFPFTTSSLACRPSHVLFLPFPFPFPCATSFPMAAAFTTTVILQPASDSRYWEKQTESWERLAGITPPIQPQATSQTAVFVLTRAADPRAEGHPLDLVSFQTIADVWDTVTMTLGHAGGAASTNDDGDASNRGNSGEKQEGVEHENESSPYTATNNTTGYAFQTLASPTPTSTPTDATPSLDSASASAASSTGGGSSQNASSPNPATTTTSSDPRNKQSIIIGVVVSAIAVLLLLAAALFLYKRHKRARDRRAWERTHEEIASVVREVGGPARMSGLWMKVVRPNKRVRAGAGGPGTPVGTLRDKGRPLGEDLSVTGKRKSLASLFSFAFPPRQAGADPEKEGEFSGSGPPRPGSISDSSAEDEAPLPPIPHTPLPTQTQTQTQAQPRAPVLRGPRPQTSARTRDRTRSVGD